jgi:hypothetical protein
MTDNDKKPYNRFLNEISDSLVKKFVGAAREKISGLIKNRSANLPQIIKHSKGIAAASKRPLPFYGKPIADDPLKAQWPGFDEGAWSLYKTYKEQLDKRTTADNSFERFFLWSDASKKEPHDDAAIIIAALRTNIKSRSDQEWALKSYLRGEWRAEDIVRVGRDIDKFNALKPQLAPDKKDLNSYKKLSELYRELDKHEKVKLSKKKMANMVKAKGTVQILDTPDMKIVQLKNFGAAKFYCAGTRWCFTEDYETFKEYKNVYIIFTKIRGKERKFAYHPRSQQFMDEQDDPISYNDQKALSKMQGFDKITELAWAGRDFETAANFEMLKSAGKPIASLELKILDRMKKMKGTKEERNNEFGDIIDNYIGSLNKKARVATPEFENYMLYKRDVDESIDYAIEIGQRFPALEARIVNRENHYNDTNYVYNVIKYTDTFFKKKAWPESEPGMIKVLKRLNLLSDVPAFLYTMIHMLRYSLFHTKHRFPEIEGLFPRIEPLVKTTNYLLPSQRREMKELLAAYTKKYMGGTLPVPVRKKKRITTR